jgi:hypothetical protein
MSRLVIEPEAEEELADAALRYEEAVPGLGRQFLAEMRQRTRDVLEAPLTFPVFGEAASTAVHILAFMHPRQRPGYWSHRRPR